MNTIDLRSADLQILIHHIYEYKKGVRNMVLHTMNSKEQAFAEHLLRKKEICYFVQNVNQNKCNVFFGNPECVKVIESYNQVSLSDYTPEQDFILGIMLGYDRKTQVERYNKRKFCEKEVAENAAES